MPTPLRAGLVVLVLASPAALAQTINLGFAGTVRFYNQGDCNGGAAYTVTWTSSGLGSGNACGNTQIFVTNSQSCPTTPNTSGSDGGTQDVIIGTIDINTIATGSGQLTAQNVRDIPGLAGSCPDGQDVTNAVCASVQYRAVNTTTCDTTLNASNTISVRYDAKPPVAPSMNLLAQDAKIQVQLGPNNETLDHYEIEYAQVPSTDAGPDWRRAPDLAATKTSQPITGLTNGLTYFVRARSVDEATNVGPFTDPAGTATPQASNGFWAEYKDAGGHELGGCSTADAAVPSVLGALGVLAALFRRRR